MHNQVVIEAFALLGVAHDADAKTIRKAWRALVRTYHPDQYCGDKGAANRRLAELNAAFDLVISAEAIASSPADDTRAHAKAEAARQAQAKAAQEATERGRQAKMRAQREQARQDANAAARRRAAELDRLDAEAARRKATRPVRTLSAADIRASQAAKSLFAHSRQAFSTAMEPQFSRTA